MPQSTSLQTVNDYCVLRLTGAALPADEIRENIDAVLQYCRDNGLMKGIIHRTEKAMQVASTGDFFNLGDYLAQHDLDGYRFALVFPKEYEGDRIDFFKHVTSYRGVDIRRFENYDDAVEWLSG